MKINQIAPTYLHEPGGEYGLEMFLLQLSDIGINVSLPYWQNFTKQYL